MRQLSILFALFFIVFFKNESIAQTGVGTNNPNSASNVEISATNKGLLIPRFSVNSITNKNPIVNTPAEGLLAFNTNATTKKTLFHWDATANSGNGAWNVHLLFKETPKTAIIGMNGSNIPLLNNADAGNSGFIGGATNNHVITSSGYLPNLSVSKSGSNRLRVTVGEGTYMLDISLLITAPAPDAGRGTALQGSYYLMGYYIDFIGISAPRTERSALSAINQPHRVNFSTVFVVSTTTATFEIALGRRSGSTHNDLVNVIPNGSYYKLTKLK